jgi:hypothetical protein
LGITALAVPAAALTMAASPVSTPPPDSSPGPSPTSVADPTCAFTNGCTSPTASPNTSVQGASTGVPTPATGADPGVLVALGSLPAVAAGIAAIRWARRKR